MIELYEHQKRIVEKNPKKSGLWHQLGTGKTITALALAKKNNIEVLIVVPKPVRRKWHKAMVDMQVEGLIMSREEFRKMAPTMRGDKFKGLIIDESHFGFCSLKAQLHKKTKWFIKQWHIEYVWLLTGTVYTSSAWSVYGAAQLLGVNWNYRSFQERFFQPRWLGARMIWEPKAGTQEDLAACVRSIGDVVRLDNCADIPEQTVEVEYFEKTKEQEAAEKYVKEDESNPLVRTTKYHQIASGVKIGTEFTGDEFFDSKKNDRIIEYAEENPKLVVFSRYNIHLDVLSKMLTEKKIPHAIVNGKTEDKEVIFEQAEKSERFVLLINAACSVGYELPSFGVVLFASLSYSFVDYSQAQGRVLRINALKKNLYIIMLTEGSVDEAVWESIGNKKSFNDTIFSSVELTKYER